MILRPGFGQNTSKAQKKFINPTGTYKLGNFRKNDETYGYYGVIKINLIDSNKIAMSFFICKGAPSYNSGDFIDTLLYKNNSAIFVDRDDILKACKVTFRFKKSTVELKETANYEHGPCWGHGVFAFGKFRKVNSKVPVIKDPLVDD